MTLLLRIVDDLLRLMTIIDMGAGIAIWALAVRERVLMASHAPEWRGWFTLRRITANEFSRAYRRHYNRSIQYGFAFLATIGLGVLLILLDNLIFNKPLC